MAAVTGGTPAPAAGVAGRLLSSPTAVAAGVGLACAPLAAGPGLALAGLVVVLVAVCAVGTAAGYSTSGSV